MSVRIHQIAKQTGLENKELLKILQERGFQVTTASSAIDNINAEAIIEEFTKKAASGEEPPADESAPAPEKTEKEEITPEPSPDKSSTKGDSPAGPPPPPKAPAPPSPPSSLTTPGKPSGPIAPSPSGDRPKGMIIKSKEDLLREKEAAEEARRGKVASTPPQKPQNAPTPAPRPSPPRPPGPRSSAPLPPPPGVGRPQPAPPPAPPKTPAGPPASPETASPDEPTAAAKPKRKVQVKPPIVVRDFANLLALKPFQLIAELMEMKVLVGLNGILEEELAHKLAAKHGVELDIRHRGEAQGKREEARKVDESALLRPRPPVVCILGHVDHGKTTLLDTIRKTEVTAGEFGGITQHVGAYQIEHQEHKITFLDTPGHAAFSKMRQRGAEVTDIAVLVVAADDGFMPQTDEALKFAKRSQVALMVAINKMDAKGADPDKVKKDMQDRGIAPEDWGGEVIAVPISALKGDGIDQLLEMIHLQAEIMELKAVPDGPAEGVIIESQTEQGRGATATVIVQRGTLKVGDAIVCGTESCRVRRLVDDRDQALKQAGPSTPVKVIGWTNSPETGSTFKVVKNDREAKRLAEEEIDTRNAAAEALSREAAAGVGGSTVEDLFNAIESTQKKAFKILIKGDAKGSVEALAHSLQSIESEKVDLEVVSASVGQVTKKDVEMANASGAAIIAFNVRLDNGVQGLAKHHSVSIYQHNIIYELIDIVRDLMADLLEPEIVEKKLGMAQIRQVFKIGRHSVAGCMVTEGIIRRNASVRLLRDQEVIHQGRVDSLKRFKEDATEVRAGYECGAVITGNPSIREGDLIECYDTEKLRPKL